jgi:hypothetical protein
VGKDPIRFARSLIGEAANNAVRIKERKMDYAQAAAEMSSQDIAILANKVASEKLKWTEVPSKFKEDIAYYEGKFENLVFTVCVSVNPFDDLVDVVMDFAGGEAGRHEDMKEVKNDPEVIARHVRRAKALCQARLEWELTHDSSYEELPPELNF